jgi:hypothetical protein
MGSSKRKFDEFNYCSICFESINELTILECEHGFCKECILRWMCKSFYCPLCRGGIENKELRDESIEYGIENYLLTTITKCYVNISVLSDYELDLLESMDIRPGQFMWEGEWELVKKDIPPVQIEEKISIIRILDEDDYNYYSIFNKMYLLN